MTGHNWDGSELNWRHAPEHYGAIHFHDDDIIDAAWETDFSLTVPKGLKSGLYAMRLSSGKYEDHVPFAVRPPRGKATAKAVFLLPSASYLAYANEQMGTDAPLAQLLTGKLSTLAPQNLFLGEHREYGASCYDSHTDGSGICYSSRLRPILNMRPKYSSWLGGVGSGLWQFNADTHITDWLDHTGIDYDVVSDEDLHNEGLSVIENHSVLITSTHPEYSSKEMLDALEAFKNKGGRVMYLGANGFYWRVAFHKSIPGVMEVRRNEGGIRAWEARTGEYYMSFTGEYGGLWRRNGRPPQTTAGTGFTAQGFDLSSYYRQKPDARNPRAAFIMKGIKPDELIGNFGLIGGGAAGLELDRADRLLGTPPNALVLASSENHTNIYLVVLEEILINYPGVGGQESELVRADIVFFELASGGAVFSTSSIAWAGSLSHNNYKNNVARMTENVLKRFIDPTPFK
jgi:N,N-dimethylformamidase